MISDEEVERLELEAYARGSSPMIPPPSSAPAQDEDAGSQGVDDGGSGRRSLQQEDVSPETTGLLTAATMLSAPLTTVACAVWGCH